MDEAFNRLVRRAAQQLAYGSELPDVERSLREQEGLTGKEAFLIARAGGVYLRLEGSGLEGSGSEEQAGPDR